MNMNAPMGPKGEVRPPLISFLFTVGTCGLYAFWWVFKLTGEINTFLGYDRLSPLKLILFTMCTGNVYGLYFIFVEGKNVIKEMQVKAGMPESPPFLADIVRMQGAVNKIWEHLP